MTPQDQKDIARIRDNAVRGLPVTQADALWLIDMVELLAWKIKRAEVEAGVPAPERECP